MIRCIHLDLHRIDTKQMNPKPPAVGGYRCTECGEILVAQPYEIRVVASLHAETAAGN